MRWQLKFFRNALFGLMPFPEALRKLHRQWQPYPSKIKEGTLEAGIQQVSMIKSMGFTVEDKVLLELGPGWQPVIPLIFYLAGCRKIILVDNQKLLDEKLLKETINELRGYKKRIADALGISQTVIESKLEISVNEPFDKTLRAFNVQYLAPCNILNANLADNSVDIIISRSVLEHIPYEQINKIFAAFKRFLKEDGLMCHFIDNSDHWSHVDNHITKVNFLKFSDRVNQLLNAFNPLDYQNQLRHVDYLNLLECSGFKVKLDRSEVDEQALSDLRKITLSKRYRKYSDEDLAVLSSKIIAAIH